MIRALERVGGGPRLKIPLLIRMAAAFAGLWTACTLLLLVMMLLIALFSHGPFEFNGSPVSRAEFLRRGWPVALAFGLVATCFGTIAVGVWRERSWVRPAVLAFWLAISALLVGQGVVGDIDLFEAIVWPVIYIGFVGWYFYSKPNVVAYYRALERRELDEDNHSTNADRRTAV